MVHTILHHSVMTYSWYIPEYMVKKDKRRRQWHYRLVLKKMEVSQKPIRKAVSVLVTFKMHDNQTLLQCFSMSPSILAYIKRERSLMAPEKCKKVSNFIPAPLLSTEHYSLTSSLIFFGEQGGQRFKAPHRSPVCPAFMSQRRSSNVTFNCPSNAIWVDGEYVIQPKGSAVNGMWSR